MKLIQINQEHYIVVDDSEIKEDCWALHMDPLGGKEIVTANGQCKLDKKITHSTQPLAPIKELIEKGYDNILPLDIDEIKELIGEVDVEKKAFEYTSASQAHRRGFIDGYNQALEDNKNKKYTEEDMFRMLCLGNKLEKTNFDDQNFSVFFNMFKKHIQSLQPKTEWEVEIINGKLKLK